MAIIHYLLDMYLAIVLGTSGISKIDNPTYFIIAFRVQYKIPSKFASLIGKVFSWGELLLSIMLLYSINNMKLLVTVTIFFLFFLFLAFHMIAQARGFTQNCGCYGNVPEGHEYTNYGTLFLQTLLAGGAVALTIWTKPLPWKYYLISGIIVTVFACWLLWIIWQRRIFLKKQQGSYSSSL